MSDLYTIDEIGMPSTSTAADLRINLVIKKVKTFENRRQTKAIIQNVNNTFFKLCFESNLKKTDFAKTQQVTSESCGVSLRTIQNISKEYKKNSGKLSTKNQCQ